MKSVKVLGLFFVVAQMLLMSRDVSCLADSALEGSERRGRTPSSGRRPVKNDKAPCLPCQPKPSTPSTPSTPKRVKKPAHAHLFKNTPADRIPNRILFRQQNQQLLQSRHVAGALKAAAKSPQLNRPSQPIRGGSRGSRGVRSRRRLQNGIVKDDSSVDNLDPLDRFYKFKEESKPIYSGNIYMDSSLTTCKLKDIPQNIKIISLVLAESDINCCYEACGDLNRLFERDGRNNKQQYKQEMQDLRRANPGIIILLELSDRVVSKEGISEVAKNMDSIMQFFEEFEFDGINYHFVPSTLTGRMNCTPNIMDCYVDFLTKVRSRMSEDKLLAVTLPFSGAFSNINNAQNTLRYRDASSDYNVDNLNHTDTDEYIKSVARLPIAGMGIALFEAMQKDIDFVVVNEDLEYPNQAQNEVLVDIYYSYLHYADVYGFTVHMGFQFDGKANALFESPQSTEIVEEMCEAIIKENEGYTSGDGVSILKLGYKDNKQNESTIVKLFTDNLDL